MIQNKQVSFDILMRISKFNKLEYYLKGFKMNLVKIGAGALITVVLVLVGLNQYESYKITKKAAF